MAETPTRRPHFESSRLPPAGPRRPPPSRLPSLPPVWAQTFFNGSLLEHVRLVAAADVFIGMHGAGFTHGLFLRRGAVVVQVLPYSIFQPDWPLVSDVCGPSNVHYYMDMATARGVSAVETGVGRGGSGWRWDGHGNSKGG